MHAEPSRKSRTSRVAAFFCGCLVLMSMAAAQSSQFSGPTEGFANKPAFEMLSAALQQGNYADAAERLDVLTLDHADQFLDADGVLVSVRTLLESLPANQKVAARAEYDKIVGEAARQGLESIKARVNRRPEELTMLAAGYPFSVAARDAYGLAAWRSLELGDNTAATALYQRAKELGWSASESQQKALDTAARRSLAPAMPLAAPTPWIGLNPPPAARRVLPVHSGGMIFIATERAVIATRETGELVWQNITPKSDVTPLGIRNGVYRPSVLCDERGLPLIVIVRQPIVGTRFGGLRAFRATDGKLLWSSDTTASLGSYSLASLPSIAGRHTWTLAIDDSVRPAPMALVALETTTGKLIAQVTLGHFNTLQESREPGSFKETDSLWQNPGPAIDGADLIVATNRGLIARIDRFDGKIRWARNYPSVPSPGDDLLNTVSSMRRGDRKAREDLKIKSEALRVRAAAVESSKTSTAVRPRDIPEDTVVLAELFSQPSRWMGGVAFSGEVAVLAPSDSPLVLGVERVSGKQLWELPSTLADDTLLGISGNVAVFAGPNRLTGIAVRDGATRWTWPATPKPLESTPALAGKALRVIVGGKIVTLNAETGQEEPSLGTGPAIRNTLNHEQSRGALNASETMSSLVKK